MVKSACKNKGMAISIIEIITDAMSPGTQKDALLSVAEWIRSTAVDDHIFKMTREERQKRIEELLSKCGYQKPKQKKLKLCS